MRAHGDGRDVGLSSAAKLVFVRWVADHESEHPVTGLHTERDTGTTRRDAKIQIDPLKLGLTHSVRTRDKNLLAA